MLLAFPNSPIQIVFVTCVWTKEEICKEEKSFLSWQEGEGARLWKGRYFFLFLTQAVIFKKENSMELIELWKKNERQTPFPPETTELTHPNPLKTCLQQRQ